MDNILRYTLNGTTLGFDTANGALVELSHPGTGNIIQKGCSLIDVAWPTLDYDYEILRAEPCGKFHPYPPVIEKTDTQIIVTWEKLPQNIATPEDMTCLEGRVRAQIIITAFEDGKSLSWRCHVKNNSNTKVAQVMFPNFSGLAPIGDREEMRLTSMKTTFNPFEELDGRDPRKRSGFFAYVPSVTGKMLTSGGGVFGDFVGRWCDFGGRHGGMSVYRRHWGWGPDDPTKMGSDDKLFVKMDQSDQTMRLAGMHYTDLSKGGEYDSGEYIMTLHEGSWIKGAAPYKKWVKQNSRRVVPVPQHAREMFGYRFIWMFTGYPKDPDNIVWKYDDFPALADDMEAHGLYDLLPWLAISSHGFPVDENAFPPELGGFECFKKNVQLLRDRNIDTIPFVTWMSLWGETCDRYGITERNGSWAETPKAIPVFMAPYLRRHAAVCYGSPKEYPPQWKQEVLDSFRFLRDKAGCPSLSWDQYLLGNDGDETVYELFNEYRRETYEKYPEATFSGESCFFFERETDNIEFSNGWTMWETDKPDFRPYLYIADGMRPNINLDANPLLVKYTFMDNLMAQIYPAKPGDINGSAMISDFPEFSQALKNCTALRQAYLPYFVDGTMLGDCILTKDCKNARATAYELNDSIVAYVVKSDDDDVVLHYDVTPFIGDKPLTAVIRDEQNRELTRCSLTSSGTLTLSGHKEDLLVIELTH